MWLETKRHTHIQTNIPSNKGITEKQNKKHFNKKCNYVAGCDKAAISGLDLFVFPKITRKIEYTSLFSINSVLIVVKPVGIKINKKEIANNKVVALVPRVHWLH